MNVDMQQYDELFSFLSALSAASSFSFVRLCWWGTSLDVCCWGKGFEDGLLAGNELGLALPNWQTTQLQRNFYWFVCKFYFLWQIFEKIRVPKPSQTDIDCTKMIANFIWWKYFLIFLFFFLLFVSFTCFISTNNIWINLMFFHQLLLAKTEKLLCVCVSVWCKRQFVLNFNGKILSFPTRWRNKIILSKCYSKMLIIW